MGLLLDLAGIGAGNLLWLIGLAVAGLGLGLIRATPETVLKLVGYMSLSGSGQPEGLAQKLQDLVQPRDRTTSAGIILLLLGLALCLSGCYLVKICAG